jgi:hypothetical protein
VTESRSAERSAAAVFAAALAVAFVVFMVAGRHTWFFLDEWDFLATRHIGSFRDLMRPHNEHWSTLPIIVYRVLWRLFGLRTYVPYLVPVVLLHLVTATLLRAVMRRAGVGPWLATAAAGLFLFLGSGYQNIVWGFQIGFVGSLACGLAHLLLSDHDGPFDRRDGIGLAFGVVGLLCSGVAVTMVAIVVLSVLLRRGWRPALLHGAPLAVLFGVWYLAYGHEGVADDSRPDLGELVRFVGRELLHAARSIGDLDVVTILLVAVLLVGGALWAVDRRAAPATDANRSWAPWALAAGAVLFAVVTGSGRVSTLGVAGAEASRYVHLLGAMLLPAVAVAGQAIVRRWPYALPVLVVLLLVAIPGNVAAAFDQDSLGLRLLRGNPDLVEALPTVGDSMGVRDGVEPDRLALGGVTIGWLREGRAAGKIPKPSRDEPFALAEARARLSVSQLDVPARKARCRTLAPGTRRTLSRGDRIGFRGEVTMRVVLGHAPGPPLRYRSALGATLQAEVDRVTVRLDPLPGTGAALC